jgi:hypothetical protein
MTAIELLERELKETLDLLESMAKQHCHTTSKDDSEPLLTDSGAITANGEALEKLAEHKRFKVTRGFGRMICGYWPENAPKAGADEVTK